jgi:hypothetical protein
MLRITINFILSLILAISQLFAQGTEQKKSTNGPKLEIVGGDTYDWKKVTPKDMPLKAKIQLKNTGNDILKIAEVKPGCGCTTAPLDKNELKPGEIATMDVTLTIGGNSSQMVSKSIRIASNDPDEPNKMLFLKANIYHAIEILSPAFFGFNEMTVGNETTAIARVKNNSTVDLTLSNFEMTPETAKINVNKQVVLKTGETFEFKAIVKPNAVGYYNCSLRMKTDNADTPDLMIYGYGQVKEAAATNPK